MAVQIKSGDSYFPNDGDEFEMSVDQRHLDYWLNYTVPVILIGYSPRRNAAVWMYIREYVQRERDFYKEPVTRIRIPAQCIFDRKALSTGVLSVAVLSDARLALKAIDMCLRDNHQERFDGLRMLSLLPDSRNQKIVCLMAHRLITDTDVEVSNLAVSLFGFIAALNIRLWATVGPEQHGQCKLAFELCRDLSQQHITRILECYDEARFDGLLCGGDELIAMIYPCFDRAEAVLNATARDPKKSIKRRANALRLLHRCTDDEKFRKACEELGCDETLRDVINWILLPKEIPNETTTPS